MRGKKREVTTYKQGGGGIRRRGRGASVASRGLKYVKREREKKGLTLIASI